MRFFFFILVCVSSFTFAEKRNQIRLVSEVMPPYQYYSDGQVIGRNIDKLHAAFSQAGIPFPTVELYPWARSYNAALEHKNTFIFPVVRTPVREKDFIWVALMATAKYSIYGLKSRQDIQLKDVNDVSKYSIAVTKKDITHKYFLQHGFEDGEAFLISSDWPLIEKLFFNQKLDLFISTPRHFELQLQRNNAVPSDYEEKLQLDDLRLEFYLSANKNTDKQLLDALKNVTFNSPVDY